MATYYVGSAQSDITTSYDSHKSDPFFAGSVTTVGNGDNGNVGFNSTYKVQIKDRFSKADDASRHYLKFFTQQCHKIKDKDPDAKFFPYSSYFHEMIPTEYAGDVICANKPEVMEMLNNKIEFKKLMSGNVTQAPYSLMKGADVLKLVKDGTFPMAKEVVIQAAQGIGGQGTWICTKARAEKIAEELKSLDPCETYIVSDYIKNIGSVSVHTQISNNEVALYPAGIQIVKDGEFHGVDLNAFRGLDRDAQNACYLAARQFGTVLQQHPERIRGYFGLDLIVTPPCDGPRAYVVETNARMTCSTPALNIKSHEAGIGGVFQHTYDAHYADKTNFASKFCKIQPNIREKFADVERDEHGLLVSTAHPKYNREGLDQTHTQENDEVYTHCYFEKTGIVGGIIDGVKHAIGKVGKWAGVPLAVGGLAVGTADAQPATTGPTLMTEAAIHCEQTDQILKCIDRAKELKKEYTIKYTPRGAWNPYAQQKAHQQTIRAAVLSGLMEEFPAKPMPTTPKPIVPSVYIPSNDANYKGK